MKEINEILIVDYFKGTNIWEVKFDNENIIASFSNRFTAYLFKGFLILQAGYYEVK